jgi:hypothetical protein
MDSDTVFENEAIRDTSEKISANSDSGEFTAKTICVMNGLDQDVTLLASNRLCLGAERNK